MKARVSSSALAQLTMRDLAQAVPARTVLRSSSGDSPFDELLPARLLVPAGGWARRTTAVKPEEARQDVVASKVIRQLRPRSPGSGDETHPDQELVFVICSFDPDMDPVFDAVACAAASVGLRAARVRDFQGDYRITDKILTLVRAARLIVADLSHDRPNVYFELGYARGIDKPVITILRTGTVPHFDAHDWTYLEYIDSRPLEHQLLERFRFEVESSDPASSLRRPGRGLTSPA